MKTPNADTPLAHLARILGMPESRVAEVFVELDRACRVSALKLHDGRAGLTYDAAAVLLLTCLVDPPEGMAVACADAIADTTCRRLADIHQFFATPESEGGIAALPEIVGEMLKNPDCAHSLSAGTERGHLAAAVRYDFPNQNPHLASFIGPDVAFADGGAVVSRMKAIDCACLPALAKQLGCVEIEPISTSTN